MLVELTQRDEEKGHSELSRFGEIKEELPLREGAQKVGTPHSSFHVRINHGFEFRTGLDHKSVSKYD